MPFTTSVQEVDDDRCPKCHHHHITSSLSSPSTSFHECYRCGYAWETKEDGFERASGVDLSWLNEGPGSGNFFEDFARAQAMRQSGGKSRNLSDIASKDNRLQAIHERLEENAQRTAGKRFSPREQQEFINEGGVARNLDMLDLEGTHYTTRSDWSGKANGANVPDEELFLGI